MNKKIISGILSGVMVVSLCVPAVAVNKGEATEEMIQREIERKTEEIVASVYDQFVQQDALELIDVYREIISANVENEIRANRNQSMASNNTGITPNARYRLTNGGLVTYETTDTSVPGNTQHFDIAVTYLDRQRAYDLVLEECSFRVSSIITTALGYIPMVGGILSAVFYIDSTMTAATISDIADCNGYAMVTNIICEETGGEASVINGWSAHPYCTTPSYAENVHVTYFSAYAS